MNRILVMTPEAEAVRVLRHAFEDGDVRCATSPGELRSATRGWRVELVFADIGAVKNLTEAVEPGDVLEELATLLPGARIVVLSHQNAIREAVELVRCGAGDYLTYPIVEEEARLVRDGIERRDRLGFELRHLRDQTLQAEVLGPISSRADSMKAVLRKVRQVAPTRSTVLLTGETGTGKSFLAKLIHQNSTRADRQFISLHCGAIPDTLLESELFGHERGAFTGADRRKPGKFEIAHGGTLFLDEIATVSPAMQVKLLNVLQERVFQRVGGEQDIEVDVRILTATNMKLDRLVAEGSFRSDLYYRLNVFPIEVPPLRERREDILPLARTMLERLSAVYGKDPLTLHPLVEDAFTTYPWPGNVRELENLLERAVILESSSTLVPESFPDELFGDSSTGRIPVDTRASIADVRRRAVEHAELTYLREQLAAHGGRIDATAAAAGITPRQLHKLMSKLGLNKNDFKHTG